jgi:hypothetical protein
MRFFGVAAPTLNPHLPAKCSTRVIRNIDTIIAVQHAM